VAPPIPLPQPEWWENKSVLETISTLENGIREFMEERRETEKSMPENVRRYRRRGGERVLEL
jgi:hypothetical protein